MAAGGLSVQCLPALAASGLSLSSSFTWKVTATSASPASLMGRGCPSHCGASSLVGAQLCCSVSMKANACTHLWLSKAGGNLLGKIKYVYDLEKNKYGNDAVRLCLLQAFIPNTCLHLQQETSVFVS